MPASSIFRLARTSRFAMVSRGTRKARAISSVLSPPRVRSVSATWPSSARAGWQQVKSSSRRSSGIARVLHLVLGGLGHLEQPGLLGEGAVAADPVDRPVAGRRHQPGARVVRRPIARPALGGDREGLLSGLLGEVEVAEEADQVGEDAAPLVAEDPLEDRLDPPRAAGSRPLRPAGRPGSSTRARSRRRGRRPRRRANRQAPP